MASVADDGDISSVAFASPTGISPVTKQIKQLLVNQNARRRTSTSTTSSLSHTDLSSNAQKHSQNHHQQRFSFEQEIQSKLMARHLKLRSIHRRFKSSSEAMMCRLYKDLNDFPEFPNVCLKLIFENGNEHVFRRIGHNQREAIEQTQQALDHELQQQHQLHQQQQQQQQHSNDAPIVDEDGDVKALKVVITPMRGPWRHAAVPFRLDLPKTYPQDPPKITCMKRIYHPSVDQKGYVCLGLINEWVSFLNLEAIVIELENLLVEPSPRRPLVKDVGNELFENPELFEEHVKVSMRGGVVRGVYYDRLAGVPPVDVGHDTLKNICFNKIFEFLKANRRAELKMQMELRAKATLAPLASSAEIGQTDLQTVAAPAASSAEETLKGKEKLDPNAVQVAYGDDDMDVPVGGRSGSGSGLRGSGSWRTTNNFDRTGIQRLPLELREIVEDYMSIIDINERRRRIRINLRDRETHVGIGGKLFVKNLAGNMIELDGVRPEMTIWQVKELLDAKTGMVPHTIQLFWHQVLDDKKTVADYGIRQGSVVYIVLSWGGG